MGIRSKEKNPINSLVFIWIKTCENKQQQQQHSSSSSVMGPYSMPYTVYPCLLHWSLLHVSYSNALSTKSHLRFPEPACFGKCTCEPGH